MLLKTALLFLIVALAPQEVPPVAEVKEAFLKRLDRKKVPLNPSGDITRTEGGLVTEALVYAKEQKPSGRIEGVPVLLVRPEKITGRLPAVVVLHGTGGNKEAMLGWCKDLAG